MKPIQKLQSMSYRIILAIAIGIVIFYIYIFRNIIHKSLIETMGDSTYGVIDREKINHDCQTTYINSVIAVLTGPSIDPTNGYVSDKDALKMVNAVNTNCKWNNKPEIEKKYKKFQTTLADTSDKNQINNLLIQIKDLLIAIG